MERRLIINKLIITGNSYKRTLPFSTALNIISGDGYSGKSLVLRLINYCLGSNESIDLNVQKELAEFCNTAFVEVTINDSVFTFSRQFKAKINEIKIYLSSFEKHEEYSPWKKNVNETNEFISNELGINYHTLLRKKQGSSDLTEDSISFRDFMRFIFIPQGELGTSNFLNNQNAFVFRKNKEVFKIIANLIVPDLEEIEFQVMYKQNEYNK